MPLLQETRRGECPLKEGNRVVKAEAAAVILYVVVGQEGVYLLNLATSKKSTAENDQETLTPPTP
jgi:hypothetical protein